MRHSLAGVLFGAALVVPFLVSAQSACTPLYRGSTGPAVIALQQFLYTQYADFPAATGYFGPTTEAAVRQWQKDHGIRIDHILASPQATDRMLSAGIDKHTRGWEKPSDHVPVWVELRE